MFDGVRGNGVASLGSFHPNKRQLFQLKVAKRFPDTQFTLMGNKASEKYYQKCLNYCEKHQLTNVELRVDAPAEAVESTLRNSRIFLHSMKNEPFGISTVEALNRGCIPAVHNSGGQREIVSVESLRYDNLRECVAIVRKVKNRPFGNRLEKPFRQLNQYTKERFIDELADYSVDF
jgi:glycosyltransferase involved in cell wall biosynthesis